MRASDAETTAGWKVAAMLSIAMTTRSLWLWVLALANCGVALAHVYWPILTVWKAFDDLSLARSALAVGWIALFLIFAVASVQFARGKRAAGLIVLASALLIGGLGGWEAFLAVRFVMSDEYKPENLRSTWIYYWAFAAPVSWLLWIFANAWFVRESMRRRS